MNSIKVAIFVSAICLFIEIQIGSAKIELEHIDPNGFVRSSPLNQAKRNWLEEKPIEILKPEIPEKRIIEGDTAKTGSAPYLVLIQYQNLNHWCGGAIYNTRTVVTAAHCLYIGTIPHQVKVTDLKFVAGELNLNFLDHTEMRRIGVRVAIHPKYDPEGFINDIAVVKLHEPIRYTYAVQPIPIAKQGVPPSKGKLYIGGFGYTRKREMDDELHAHYFSSVLNVAEVNVLSRSECKKKFKGFMEVMDVISDPSVFCAEGEVNNGSAVDACQGDSGGPAVCLDSNKKKYLCGVVNTGMGCGVPGYPGIYCDVSYFHDWISEVAGTPPDLPTRNY